MIVVLNGTPLKLGGVPLSSGYRVLDSLNYADGPIHGLNGWVDAYSLYPSMFDEAVVVDGRLSAQATHTPPDAGALGPNGRVGHTLVVMDTGLSDNFELSIDWNLNNTWAGAQQVSPCCFVDLEAADPEQMGVMPVWDLSLNATYVQNVFRCPVASVADPAYYTSLGASESGGPAAGDEDTQLRQVITVRVQSGVLSYWWDGNLRGNPNTSITVPAWAEGRTWMGINVHSLDWVTQYPNGDPVLMQSPGEASFFRVRAL